jgi:hypothetical protein
VYRGQESGVSRTEKPGVCSKQGEEDQELGERKELRIMGVNQAEGN